MNYVYNVVKDEGDSYKSDFVQKAYHYEYDNITDNEYPLEGKKNIKELTGSIDTYGFFLTTIKSRDKLKLFQFTLHF